MKPAPSMDDLPFMSIRASALFAGRTNLKLHEVAKALGCTARHVGDLIQEGKLGGIDVSGRPIKKGKASAANIRHWRVPVSAYEQFIDLNKSL